LLPAFRGWPWTPLVDFDPSNAASLWKGCGSIRRGAKKSCARVLGAVDGRPWSLGRIAEPHEGVDLRLPFGRDSLVEGAVTRGEAEMTGVLVKRKFT
jgi:hypothetical protein